MNDLFPDAPKRPELEVSRLKLSVEHIATGFGLPEADVYDVLADGRAMSFWAMRLAARVYRLPIDVARLEGNTTALRGDLGLFGAPRFMIRTMGRSGVRFQRNMHIGKGRGGSQDDLIKELAEYERFIVVAIDKVPLLEFFPLPGKELHRQAKTWHLTLSGVERSKFREWVGSHWQVAYREATIG